MGLMGAFRFGFTPLRSVGSFIDESHRVVYPAHPDGCFDPDEGTNLEDVTEEWLENLDEDDRRIVGINQ